MEEQAQHAYALADLARTAIELEHYQHHITQRAQVYLAAGAIEDLTDVLDVLSISKATWYRRVREYSECLECSWLANAPS